MPRLKVDGVELHYEDTGGVGPPVVFAHGLLWSGTMFRFQVEALRGTYRCISFDFRGQGRSEIARSGYDMDTLTRDTATLIERLRAWPCHFVGLSMGGFVGMRLARQRPELLRSLSLLHTAGDAEPLWRRPRYALMGLATRLLGPRVLIRPVMKILFGRSFLRDPAQASLRDSLRDELLRNDVDGELLALRGVLRRSSFMDDLSSLQTPTLVLSGDEDVGVIPKRSQRTADRIPGARFV
ncbi:MAG TPA: alpha/beta fold hydrolase, partial [Myxococcales bacterium]|nr:alpha/beta fold hydrolase [Myxococcales bacterium]